MLQNTRLSEIAYVAATTAASVYSNPATTKTFVRGILLHNINTTTESVSIFLVPDSSGTAGTATNAHRIFRVDLTANETLIIEFPSTLVLLDTADTIQAFTTTASKVTILILGDKE